MVEAWQGSGLSAHAFANTHHISKGTLLRWQQRSCVASRVTVPSFVPVHVSHDDGRESVDASSACSAPAQPFAHVTRGRLHVQIMPGSTPRDVKLLLEVLAEVQSC